MKVEIAGSTDSTTNPLWVEAEEVGEGDEDNDNMQGSPFSRKQSSVLLSGELVEEGLRILANELGDVSRHPQPRLLAILHFFCSEGHRRDLEAEGLGFCADELSIDDHHLWGPRMASLQDKAVRASAIMQELTARGVEAATGPNTVQGELRFRAS